MNGRILCPCCGEYKRNFSEDLGICPICGWEEDCVQESNPDYIGGANVKSLNDCRAAWQQKQSQEAVK